MKNIIRNSFSDFKRVSLGEEKVKLEKNKVVFFFLHRYFF